MTQRMETKADSVSFSSLEVEGYEVRTASALLRQLSTQEKEDFVLEADNE